MGYPNLSPIIGAVVSSKLATLHEIQTVYGSEDLLDLYEVVLVRLHNENILYNKRKKK